VSIITSYCHFRVTYASNFGVKESKLLNPENGSRMLDNENGGYNHSSTQPVDILLVTGNLSVSSEEKTHLCKLFKQKIASNLVYIVINMVFFFCYKLSKMIFTGVLVLMFKAPETLSLKKNQFQMSLLSCVSRVSF